MGFENFKPRTSAREAALAAAAIAGMELPAAALTTPSQAPQEFTQTYKQIDTAVLGENIEDGLDELQDDRENGFTPDKNYENIAPPPSIVETLEQNGNQNALRTYQTGVEQFRTYATVKSEEDIAFFSLTPDGVGKWVEPEVLFRLDNSKDISADVKYGTVAADSRKLLDTVGQGNYVVDIHTHPTSMLAYEVGTKQAYPQTRHVPPSPADVFRSLDLVRRGNFKNTDRLESRTITEKGSWRYGFVSDEAAQNFNRSLQEPVTEALPLLKLPSHQLQVEMLGVHFSELSIDENVTAEQKELYKIMGELMDESNKFSAYIEKFPTFVEHTVSLLESIISDSDTQIEGVDELLSTLKNVRDKQQAALRLIDEDYMGGSLISPPDVGGNKVDTNYLNRWKRLGVYMESRTD